jgi:hypothetical protein
MSECFSIIGIVNVQGESVSIVTFSKDPLFLCINKLFLSKHPLLICLIDRCQNFSFGIAKTFTSKKNPIFYFLLMLVKKSSFHLQ